MTATFTDDRTELLARLDLAALFADLGYPQGRNRQWPCPNPSHAQTGATPPVSIRRGPEGYDLWSCHGCGTGGTAVDLLTLARGMSVANALGAARRLAGIPELTAPPRAAVVAEHPPPEPDDGRMGGPEADELLAAFLEHRRWRREVADAHGLFVVRDRRGRPRIRFPYRDRGETVWWQDRAIDPTDETKWMGPTGLQRVLYARDLFDALDNPAPPLWIAEGPADAIALAHLFADVDAAIVAIPGTSGVHRWAPMLADRDVLIVTDPDEPGDRAAAELERLTVERGGRADRLRPPLDLDDWRRQYPDDLAWSDAVAAELDRQHPAEDGEVTR